VSLPSNLPNPSTGREYLLNRVHLPGGSGNEERPRVVPSRPSGLRCGGGRKDKDGWTKQKLQTCRRALASLVGIRACLTVTMEPDRCPSEYKAVNDLLRSICRRFQLPCVCVWEGPNPHCHIGFSEAVPDSWRDLLKRRLEDFWVATWGIPMGEKAFYFDPDAKPKKTIDYLGKDETGSNPRKEAYDWLSFCPWWKSHVAGVGKRKTTSKKVRPLLQPEQLNPHLQTLPSTLSPSVSSGSNPSVSTFSPSPSTIVQPQSDTQEMLLCGKPVCPVCWHRWCRALMQGHCICTGHVRRGI